MSAERQSTHDTRLFFYDLIFLTILAVVIFALFGAAPLFTPDEGRYAEIGREMAANHQYLVPHLDGVIYFEKPPLIYWITAFFIKLFGPSVWAARLVNPVLSLLAIWVTYIVVFKIYQHRWVALWSAIIVMTSLLFTIAGRYLSMDAGLGALLSISLLSYAAHLQTLKRFWPSTGWLLLAFLAAAGAMMTKGLIGLVFPMAIVGIWALICQQYRRLADIRLYLGVILVIGFSTPWIYWVNQAHSGFAYYYIVVQQILRYLTNEQDRQMSKIVYIALVWLCIFPWSAFLIQALKRVVSQWKQRIFLQYDWFFLIWAGVIVIFFAFSQSMLAGYLTPIVIPFAILIVRYLQPALDRGFKVSDRVGILIVAILLTLMGIFCLIVPWVDQFLQESRILLAWLYPLALVLAIIVSLTIYAFLKQSWRWLIVSWVGLMVVLPNLGMNAGVYLSQKTAYPVISDLKTQLKTHPNAIVAVYNDYFYDVPYYLNQKVWMVDQLGELRPTSKMPHSGAKATLKTKAQLWKVWQSGRAVYVIMRPSDYERYFKNGSHQGELLAHTAKVYLVTNQRKETP